MSDTDTIIIPRAGQTRDLGIFRVTDPLPPEVHECGEQGHFPECREFSGYFLHYCRDCGYRFRVIIEDEP